MKYKESVDELTGRKTNRDDITIEPVKAALEELDKPDDDYPVVLVGGTNGKGSTVEMISEMLHSQGKKVGTTKSPHLVDVRERIQVNGQPISKRDFLELYQEINGLDQQLSFFEFMIVMAYAYFSEEDIDYAVIEVGLGGRFDATNAAESELSVITNVDLDHTQILGETREEIAEEKAGIIPENGKIITKENLQPIEETAEERSSEIIRPPELEELDDGNYRFDNQKFQLPVEGRYQAENLENSLAAVKELERLPEDIGKALSGLSCPGRMEKISEDPEVILDGAHNPAALKKIIQDLPEDFTCVFNSIERKESSEMIEILSQKASRFVFTESSVEWSEDLNQLKQNCSTSSKAIEDPVEAVRKAATYGEPVVVTGSLYLIGELKEKDVTLQPKIEVEDRR